MTSHAGRKPTIPHDRVLHYHKVGLTQKAIAEMFNCTDVAIHHILRKAGMTKSRKPKEITLAKLS
jgi:transcriptional regulator